MTRDPPRGDADLPVVDGDARGGQLPGAPGDRPTDAGVVGVLLAAGTSSRFGRANKLLATVEGSAVVRRAARTFVESAVDDVVVVVGHQADRVEAALSDLGVSFARNDAYDRGQATSVRTGVSAAADRDAGAAVVGLGDMPFVDPATVDALIAAYLDGAGTALAAAHDGRRGNPVLFARTHFEALAGVDGDTGGRDVLLSADRAALVEVPDREVLRDVDTPEDLPRGSYSAGDCRR